MAYYEVTYSCGHCGKVNITGPIKDRDLKCEWMSSYLCLECFKKKKKEGMEQEKMAAGKSAELKLPALTGTEKQVAWANTLRIKVIDKYKSRFAEEMPDSGAELTGAMCYILKDRTDANFWIDNRDRNDIFSLFVKMYKEYKQKTVIPDDVKRELDNLQAQLTVIPDIDSKKKGIVEIRYRENGKILAAVYIKDYGFIDIVKGLNFEWNGTVWERKITEYTGTIDDRAAELGNKLLLKGYTVRFPNELARDAAIAGTYIRENGRWIIWIDGRLAVTWNGRNDTIYEKARKLPDAVWKNFSIRVKLEYYREVQDFAEVMGFNISQMAGRIIAAYIEKEKTFLHKKIEPASAARKSQNKQLEKALKSDGVIIADLLDD